MQSTIGNVGGEEKLGIEKNGERSLWISTSRTRAWGVSSVCFSREKVGKNVRMENKTSFGETLIIHLNSHPAFPAAIPVCLRLANGLICLRNFSAKQPEYDIFYFRMDFVLLILN